MARGGRIRNEGGSLIQIDPSWECLGMKTGPFVVQTSAYTVPGVGGRTIGRAVIQVAGCNEPILAVNCSSALVGVVSKSQSGSTYEWVISTDIVGASVTYWVFDTTDVAQMKFITTKGLRMRNPANNRVIFDSRYKYMRVLQMVNTLVGTGTVDIPVPLSSGYAVGICNTGLYTRVDGGPITGGGGWRTQTVGYVAGVRTNANGTINVGLINTRSATDEGPGPPWATTT
ncbi:MULTISPECIES: hypothetical protein [unclassified Stenotrophomonas]|uniref:hypothetical protein n=1 Tax=unclassified Stenotrophomonas TaxID=196198 RepID=UPI000D173619|nr:MULTISPECIES: hypothetical protein [unclassified Stenotrophomonas]PTA70493.1 hypothetical protein C9412_17100 [Stenotrophomonas sp. Nf1]PTA77375.1 hypothetical protein C9416_15875 [Stenotrophomonas sp. Nf4]